MEKKFYRQGEKIFESGTNWSGKSTETSAPSANAIESKVSSGIPSAFGQNNQANSFNTAMVDMLKSYQGVGTADLMKQKNALLKAKYGRGSEITPEELRTLSPAQQESIRSANTEAISPDIDATNNAIIDRNQAITNFQNVFNMAQGLARDVEARDRQIKADAQTTLTGMMALGWEAFEGFTDDDLNQMAQAAGYPSGYLQAAKSNLQKVGVQPDKIISGAAGSSYAVWFDADGNIRTKEIIPPTYKYSDGGDDSDDDTILTTEEKEFEKELNKARDILAKGGSEQWGYAWDLVKNKYPDVPNELLDEMLNKNKYNPSDNSSDYVPNLVPNQSRAY